MRTRFTERTKLFGRKSARFTNAERKAARQRLTDLGQASRVTRGGFVDPWLEVGAPPFNRREG